MRSNGRDVTTKEYVFNEVDKSIKQIGVAGLLDLKQDSLLVTCLDAVLRHGLRDPSRGYWHIVRSFTHSTTLKALDAYVKYINSQHQKGQVWTYYTLEEGSFENYLTSLVQDVKALRNYYGEKSLLRDHALITHLITTLSSLRTLALQETDSLTSSVISVDSSTSECCAVLEPVTPAIQPELVAAKLKTELTSLILCHQQPELFSQLTNNSTPSVTSPVDSGVALLDSDIDVSVNEDKVQINEVRYSAWETATNSSSVASSVSTVCRESPPATLTDKDADQCRNEFYFDNSGTTLSEAGVNNNNNSIHINNNINNNNSSNNINKGKGKILKSVGKADDIVHRRVRKKKCKDGSSSKRVSFHEESTLNDLDFFDSIPQQKKSGLRNRYSWCGEGDNPYVVEKENIRRLVKSDIIERKGSSTTISLSDSEMGIEADYGSSSSTLDEGKNNIEVVCKKLNDVVKQSLGIKSRCDNYNSSSSSVSSRDEMINNGLNQINRPVTNNCKNIAQNYLSKNLNFVKEPLPIYQRNFMEKRNSFNSVPSLIQDSDRLLTNRRKFGSVISSVQDWSSDSEWSSEVDERYKKTIQHTDVTGGPQRTSTPQRVWTARMLKEAPSKTSLVNRFLRSIPERKMLKRKKVEHKSPFYIRGAKPDENLSKKLIEKVEMEIQQSSISERKGAEVVSEDMRTAIENFVLLNTDEQIYKVYRVSTLDGLPLLTVLTSTTIYLTGLDPVTEKYCNFHVIAHKNLDTVIIGPNSQTIMLVAVEHNYNLTVITALGEEMVSDLVSHLEISMRRIGLTHLSVKTLNLSDMAALWHSINKQTSVEEDEKMVDYIWARLGDTCMSPPSTPLGPTKCGHLMYRPHHSSAWLPGFVILKGGVVYIFSDSKQRIPKHVVSLHIGQCGGCRRVYNSSRPHTFEILPPSPIIMCACNQRNISCPVIASSEQSSFQLAAADDYEASDWLQAFVQAASGMANDDVILHEEIAESVIGCGLVLTTHHVLILEFPDKVLSSASLSEITAIRSTSKCCVLETGCREVQEGGDDWIVYFMTEAALTQFLGNLLKLRPELEQVTSELSQRDPLYNRCEQTSQQIRDAWQSLLYPRILT